MYGSTFVFTGLNSIYDDKALKTFYFIYKFSHYLSLTVCFVLKTLVN